ncbi:hypothetical protein Y1Q_0018307 [Alligator mississippiensis]|uniref:Uncharacterized protein n=1 Tax=Alligator mississippiensis TaxID=8496 RepID=A0A151PCK7_ALLMI|nr:hypothetical protein Y1Q_0018307 [Alligator mississippiensis]
MQDQTLLPHWLVTIMEEWLVDSWVWHMKEITHKWKQDMCKWERDIHKQEKDCEEQVYRAQLLVLEERHVALKRIVAA